MLLPEIKHYEIFRPKCDPGKEVLHSIATFEADISPVFPYLNAELGGWDYDQRNQVVLLKLSAGKWITLQPLEIAIRGARDQEESQALLAWITAADKRHLRAPGRDHPPLHQPGGPEGHGDPQAPAQDQLPGLWLCHLHGLCRRPAGGRNLPERLPAPPGRNAPGETATAPSLPGKFRLAGPGRRLSAPPPAAVGAQIAVPRPFGAISITI